jgi:hypothetical protein
MFRCFTTVHRLAGLRQRRNDGLAGREVRRTRTDGRFRAVRRQGAHAPKQE